MIWFVCRRQMVKKWSKYIKLPLKELDILTRKKKKEVKKKMEKIHKVNFVSVVWLLS